VGQRSVLVTVHTGRENAVRSARLVAERLQAAGISVLTLAGELSFPGAAEVPADALMLRSKLVSKTFSIQLPVTPSI